MTAVLPLSTGPLSSRTIPDAFVAQMRIAHGAKARHKRAHAAAREGDLGPQTRHDFGRALEKAGPDGFAHKLALGQFRDYATRLDNEVERYERLKRDAWIGPKTIADDLEGLFAA
jgi:hypothetical protein